jgi:ABC-type bacteriocin/lantibiotic exporter with double-glycine peptidase domain
MERLMRGRTTFIITHRVSALQHCDFLLRIERGQVVSLKSVAARAESEALASRGSDAANHGSKTDV